MNIRRVKRKCGVRGCKNTDCFAITRTREMGNSIIACKDCISEALKAMESYKEPVKVKDEKVKDFYHPVIEETVTPVVGEDAPELSEAIADTEVEHTATTEETVQTEAPKAATKTKTKKKA